MQAAFTTVELLLPSFFILYLKVSILFGTFGIELINLNDCLCCRVTEKEKTLLQELPIVLALEIQWVLHLILLHQHTLQAME